MVHGPSRCSGAAGAWNGALCGVLATPNCVHHDRGMFTVRVAAAHATHVTRSTRDTRSCVHDRVLIVYHLQSTPSSLSPSLTLFPADLHLLPS